MSTETTLSTEDAILKAVLEVYGNGFYEQVTGESEFDNFHAFATVSPTIMLNLGAGDGTPYGEELQEIREALPEGDIAAIVRSDSQGFDHLIGYGDVATMEKKWDEIEKEIADFYGEDEDDSDL